MAGDNKDPCDWQPPQQSSHTLGSDADLESHSQIEFPSAAEGQTPNSVTTQDTDRLPLVAGGTLGETYTHGPVDRDTSTTEVGDRPPDIKTDLLETATDGHRQIAWEQLKAQRVRDEIATAEREMDTTGAAQSDHSVGSPPKSAVFPVHLFPSSNVTGATTLLGRHNCRALLAYPRGLSAEADWPADIPPGTPLDCDASEAAAADYGVQLQSRETRRGYERVHETRAFRKGGQGHLYRGWHFSLRREVAVKVTKESVPGIEPNSPREGSRLPQKNEKQRKQDLINARAAEAEVLITAMLQHPNIVPIHEVGFDESGRMFYTSAFIEGNAWSDRIKDLSLDQNLEVFDKACDAISYAHEKGIIHRDLKPANVMVGEHGAVYVVDWGMAFPQPHCPLYGVVNPLPRVGTPEYMAPELWHNPKLQSARSDVYLLGAILFEILAGHPPRASVLGSNRNLINDWAESVARNTIDLTSELEKRAEEAGSTELLHVALQALQGEPSERFDSVAELQEAVQRFRRHRECVAMARRASDQLKAARETKDSRLYSRAINLLDDALMIWDRESNGQEFHSRSGIRADNVRSSIVRQSRDTRFEAARFEQRQRNFDYALSLLDTTDPGHVALVGELKQESAQARDHQAEVRRLEERERAAHRRRLQITRVAVACAIIAGLAGFASFVMNGTITQLRIATAEANIAAAEATQKLDAANTAAAEAQQRENAANTAAAEAQLREKAANNAAAEAQLRENVANTAAAEAEKQVEHTNKTLVEKQFELVGKQVAVDLAEIDRLVKEESYPEALKRIEDLSKKPSVNSRKEFQKPIESRRIRTRHKLDQQQRDDLSADTQHLFYIPGLGSLVAIQDSGAWHQLTWESDRVRLGPGAAASPENVVQNEILVSKAVSPSGQCIARLWRPKSLSTGRARIEILDRSDSSSTTQSLAGDLPADVRQIPTGLLFLNERTLLTASARSTKAASGNSTRHSVLLEFELFDYGNNRLTSQARTISGPLWLENSEPSAEFLSHFISTDPTQVSEGVRGSRSNSAHWHVLSGGNQPGTGVLLIANDPELATTTILDVLTAQASQRPEIRLLGATTVLHPKNPNNPQERLPVLASAIDPRGKWGVSIHKSLPNRILRWEITQLRTLVAQKATADDFGRLGIDDFVDAMPSSEVLLAGRVLHPRNLTVLEKVRRAHQQPITALQFSPDGTRLVSVGLDAQLKHWHTDHSLPQLLEKVPLPTEKMIDRLRFVDPAGRIVVGDSVELRRRQALTHVQLAQVPAPAPPAAESAGPGQLLNFALVGEGDSAAGDVAGIAIGADDVNGLILRERLPDGTPGALRRLQPINPFQIPPKDWLGEGTLSANLSMAIDDTGDFLAATCIDGITRIWNLRQRRQVEVLKRPSVGIDLSVALSPRATWALIPGDRNAVAYLFKLMDGRPEFEPTMLPGLSSGGKIAAASALAFSRDERFAATGDRHGTLSLWDLKASPPKPISYPLNPKARINAIGFSSNRLFVATDSGNIHEFDFQLREKRKLQLQTFGNFVTQMAVSDDGLVAALVTTKTEGPKHEPATREIPASIVLCDSTEVNPQIRPLAQHGVTEGPANAGKIRFQQRFLSLSFARKTRRLMALEPNSTIRVWDLPTDLSSTLTEAARLKVKDGLGAANAAVLASNGSKLLTLHLQSIHQWELDLEKARFRNLGMHSSNIAVPSAAIDPTGQYVLTASPFSGIKGWAIHQNSIVGLGQMATEPPLGGYRLVRFQPRPNGQNMEVFPFATVALPEGATKAVVQVHEFHANQPQQRFQGTRSLETGMTLVNDIRYSPDGRWLVAWGSDAQRQATAAVWSVGALNQPPRLLRSDENGAAFQFGAIDPDSQLIVCATKDGKLAVWRLDAAVIGPPLATGGETRSIRGIAAFLNRSELGDLAQLRIVTMSQEQNSAVFEYQLGDDGSSLNVSQTENFSELNAKAVTSFQFVNTTGKLVILLDDGMFAELPWTTPDSKFQQAKP